MNAAIQREFTQEQDVADFATLHESGRGKHAEGNRQIEKRARLSNVGWSEIDRDSMMRILEPRVADRALHPVAAFTHRGIRQSNEPEAREPEGHVYFHADGARLDADERRGA